MLNISDFILKVIPWRLCEVSELLTNSMVQNQTLHNTQTTNHNKKNKHEGDYEKLNLESLIFRIQSGNYCDAILIILTHLFSIFDTFGMSLFQRQQSNVRMVSKDLFQHYYAHFNQRNYGKYESQKPLNCQSIENN